MWYISSKYEFIPGHSFINPWFRFEDNKWRKLLDWNTVTLDWSISIDSIQDYFKKLSQYLNTIQNVYNKIKDTLWYSNLDIKYNIIDNEVLFSNDDFQLKIKWWYLSSCSYMWNSIRLRSYDIDKLDFTLQTLK